MGTEPALGDVCVMVVGGPVRERGTDRGSGDMDGLGAVRPCSDRHEAG